MDHSATQEADATREARQRMRRAQRDDPLAERVRIISFWVKCSETNRHYLPFKGAWWHPFITQPGFRRLLMPRLRAILDTHDRESRDRYAAEMRESAARFARIKAERAAAKARAAAPQLDLLEAA